MGADDGSADTPMDGVPSNAGIDEQIAWEANHVKMLRIIGSLGIASDELFLQTTEQTRMALCISDPREPDCPIVYCNKAFTKLTGYERDEIIGRNCRFLQGRGTRREPVQKLRQAIEDEQYTVVDILNYRKDGSAFWNAVHVGPIYNEAGELAYFFGSQWDITELLAARETIIENERVAEELRHRTSNLFAVLAAIVRLSSRGVSDVNTLCDKIERRIEALATAHKASLEDSGLGDNRSNLRNLVEAVMRPYRNANTERIELAGDSIELPRKHVTPIGLTLHELATNALKYGSLSHHDGTVHIDWDVDDDQIILHWVEINGASAKRLSPEIEVKGTGSGSRLIDGVIRAIGGTIETTIAPDGLRATITMPVEQHMPA